MAPGPQVFEEQIAEGDGLYASRLKLAHHVGHDLLVHLIRAGARSARWKVDFFQRDADRVARKNGFIIGGTNAVQLSGECREFLKKLELLGVANPW